MDFAAGIAVGMVVCVVVLASCVFWASRFVDAYEQAEAEEAEAAWIEAITDAWARGEQRVHLN